MNFICKIIDNKKDTRQIIVKYSRQNCSKSIDDYQEYAVDYDNLDFTDYESLVYSIIKYGLTIIIKQLEEENCLECNKEDEPSYSVDLDDNLNKILAIDYKQIVYEDNFIKKIDL
jgi:hypothetical protein